MLNLLANSLYSNKEVFLRELISNASDAADKLRFKALTNNDLYEGDPNLRIRISVDKDAKTLTISDNGIGMSEKDAIDHLGTIAKSGTAEFIKQLSGDQAKNSGLIGQFGVGFYSAFIVADKVTVESRAAGDPKTEGVRWVSDGTGTFSTEKIEKEEHGTSVILHIKDDEKQFLDDWQIRSIIEKYSDHIGIPVEVWQVKTPEPPKDGEEPGSEGRRVEADQRRNRSLDPRAQGDQGRGVQGVLQAHQPRLGRPSCMGPQQGRGNPGVHQPALHPFARSVRSDEPRPEARSQALCPARLHHG